MRKEEAMPKTHQQRPSKERVGRNNPKESTPVPSGTYKKQETYLKQAARHEDMGKHPPLAKAPASWESHPGLTHKADSRQRAGDREARSGSESNAHKPRKASHLHTKAVNEALPHHQERVAEFDHDLAVGQRPAEAMGMGSPEGATSYLSVYEVKALHGILANLTDDELKDVPLLPIGTRLEQGAKYLDLNHLERGEFVGEAWMIAGPEHYYVPKKETSYVLWNRLNQVENPARLDETGPTAP